MSLSAEKEKLMPVNVELKIEPAEALVEQDLTYQLKLTNTGKAPVAILHPLVAVTMPIWHVRSIDTGEERIFQGKQYKFRALETQPLEAGESFDCELPLLEKVSIEKPGTYEITAEYHWDGDKYSAISNPVRVKLVPTAPRDLHLVSVAGGLSVQYLGVWRQDDEEGSQLLLAKFGFYDRPNVSSVTLLGSVGKSPVKPYLSVPVNREIVSRQWIAWLEDGAIAGFRVEDMKKDGKLVKRLKLPEVKTMIFPPLLPLPESSQDGEAAVVVLCQTSDIGKSNIQIAVIEDDGRIEEGPATPLEGGPAIWGTGVALISGERRVFSVARDVQGEKKTLTLQCTSWPKGAPQLKPMGSVKFEGDLLAARLFLGEEDEIHGAVLAQVVDAKGEVSVALHPWSQNKEGKIEPGEPVKVDWQTTESVREGKIGVTTQAETFGALRDKNDAWYFLRVDGGRGKVSPIPGAAGAATGIWELATLGVDKQVPIIMYTMPYVGFRFAKPDGSPISTKPPELPKS